MTALKASNSSMVPSIEAKVKAEVMEQVNRIRIRTRVRVTFSLQQAIRHAVHQRFQNMRKIFGDTRFC